MQTLTRSQTIETLSRRFQELVDDDHSLCEVAARFGFYCGGFAQWSLEQLKERYGWIAGKRPDITREELERLANAWQVARRQVHGVPLACDVQALEHDTCEGWDEWANEDLARFYKQLDGADIDVVDDVVDPVPEGTTIPGVRRA
jgi:hypothetical protein